MHSLQKNYSLHITVATVFASAMILITTNGVADAVKVAEEAPLKISQKHPLPPPGPFELVNSQGRSIVTDGQQPQVAFSAKAPKMPEMTRATPKSGIAPSIELKPANTGIKKNVVINTPVFNKTMPNMPQTLQAINTPVNPAQPVAPNMPNKRMAPPAVNPPVPRSMPQFRGNPRRLGAAPQIQQYRYIPLPVYQANLRHPQPPSFNKNASGYWIPQINNK